jgi:hypothetical protein
MKIGIPRRGNLRSAGPRALKHDQPTVTPGLVVPYHEAASTMPLHGMARIAIGPGFRVLT